MSNRVVHFEIPYDDQERAQAFYSELFGWQIMPMPEMDYTMVSTGPSDEQTGPTEPGFINGGMMQKQDPSQGPNLVIDVDSIDNALKQVNEHGGTTVVEKMTVGDMGFTAYFKDPEGNLVGLWENKR